MAGKVELDFRGRARTMTYKDQIVIVVVWLLCLIVYLQHEHINYMRSAYEKSSVSEEDWRNWYSRQLEQCNESKLDYLQNWFEEIDRARECYAEWRIK